VFSELEKCETSSFVFPSQEMAMSAPPPPMPPQQMSQYHQGPPLPPPSSSPFSMSPSSSGARPSARSILLSNHEHGQHRKIFVKNISFDTTEDTLRRHFENYGPIEDGTRFLPLSSCQESIVEFSCLSFPFALQW
jgi:hypothetical protein